MGHQRTKLVRKKWEKVQYKLDPEGSQEEGRSSKTDQSRVDGKRSVTEQNMGWGEDIFGPNRETIFGGQLA